MLFRCNFPVPFHGNYKSLTIYIRSNQLPNKKEIERILLRERVKAYNSNHKQKAADLSNAINALNTANHKNWQLPKGLDRLVIPCQTCLGESVIQLQFIEELEIPVIANRFSQLT